MDSDMPRISYMELYVRGLGSRSYQNAVVEVFVAVVAALLVESSRHKSIALASYHFEMLHPLTPLKIYN